MDSTRYYKLKTLHGTHSSWAVWADSGDTPKSNTSDLSVFDDENVLNILNIKYVFVGLNISRDECRAIWSNFHSPSPWQNDFKLRFAFKDTLFWGSYMTDLFKDTPDSDSRAVLSAVRSGRIDLEQHLAVLKEELAILGNPIVIAFGNDVYKLLSKHLSSCCIYKLKHYSARCSKERYREYVLDFISAHIDK